MKKIFLGDMLVTEGLITPTQRDDALADQKRVGKRLGEVLVSRGLVTHQTIARVLSKQLGLPFIDMNTARIDPTVMQMVPQKIARKHKALPIERSVGGGVLVAMADPLDVFAMDEIKRNIRKAEAERHGKGPAGIRSVPMPSLDVAVAAEEELMKALNKHYSEDIREAPKDEDLSGAEDTPVVKLLNSLMTQAVDDRASDIHIEPGANSIRVRFRVDGILHEVTTPPKNLHAGIVSRVKILSGMDIAEKRVPQDGRFDAKISNKELDVRASTLPTMYGEKVMLRLLEKTSGLPQLAELGFREDVLKKYETLIGKPFGFVLSTGPTGCGKTTTMYSSLQYINTIERNVITVEDPIEYDLAGINQVQINRRAGLTFTNALRSILRQDPDVIMIGEIRDLDTASIAMHAALTGHLVLSTLHTNNAVGAMARLLDMGIEPFIINSSLMGIIGQRLIRKICPDCKEETTVQDEIFEEIDLSGPVKVYRGKGCPTCRHTGYLGREGLFELVVVSEAMQRLTAQRAAESEMKAQAIKEGYRTMRQEGLVKVTEGITTIEEVVRVTSGVE